MLDAALSSIRDTLAVDGYTLSAAESGDGIIEVVIKAGPDACADCLIPRDILEKIIIKVLQENEVPFSRLNLITPSSAAEHY